MNERLFYVEVFALVWLVTLVCLHVRMQWFYGWLLPLLLGAVARVILAVTRRGIFAFDGMEMTLTRSRVGRVVGRWLFEEIVQLELRPWFFGRARIVLRVSTGDTFWLTEGRKEGMQQTLVRLQRLVSAGERPALAPRVEVRDRIEP